MSRPKPEEAAFTGEQPIKVLPKKDAQAVLALMNELEQSLDKVVADVGKLKSEIAQSTTDAYNKVHEETEAATATYKNLMAELAQLRKNGIQIDASTSQAVNNVEALLRQVSSTDFLYQLQNIVRQAQTLKSSVANDVGVAIEDKLADFYDNANTFTKNVQIDVEQATAKLTENRTAQVEEMSKAMDNLISAKIKRFENHIRRIEITEDTIRNWRHWVIGITAVVVLWGAFFVGVGINACSEASTAKEELKESQQDAYYWMMFRYNNPKTAAKFEQEVRGNK